MSREVISIKRKALRINLEGSIYGTFAEIGAGQEVARTFFQVGGASGTVAKTMSAYDMAFSDSIYGEEESGRYVSESRLNKMLTHEYELLGERLVGDEYEGKRFFAYANTCSILNYTKTNDPHCWMGLRFQLTPGGGYNDVIVHIRLKDNDALLQQRVIGGVGVNLIFACFWYSNDINAFIDSLMDNLSVDQIEIDLVRINGENFNIDNRLVALKLVKKGYTDATIFGSKREVYQPKDFLYKKNVLCLRSRFRPYTLLSEDMQKSGELTFQHRLADDEQFISLSELTLNNLMGDEDHDPTDFLDRAELLCQLGHTVLVSNCDKHDKLIDFFTRCKTKKIGIIVGVMNLIELFKKENYCSAPSELLSYFGGIFRGETVMIAYPYYSKSEQKVVDSTTLRVDESLSHIYHHLISNNLIVDSENSHPDLLNIFSDKIIASIQAGDDTWKAAVPEKVAELISEKHLFGYKKELIEH